MNSAKRVAPVPVVEELDATLTSAVSRLRRRMRTEKADDLISDSCRSVLVLLVKEGQRTLGELSDHERVKPPSMNQTVNVLEEFGFVQRRDDPTDGRKVILEATPSGRAFIEETRRRLHAWLQARLVELSGEERRILGEAALIIGRLADS